MFFSYHEKKNIKYYKCHKKISNLDDQFLQKIDTTLQNTSLKDLINQNPGNDILFKNQNINLYDLYKWNFRSL